MQHCLFFVGELEGCAFTCLCLIMAFRAIFLHGIEPLVKSDLPSDKTVLIFIGLLSPRGTHISASQTEKNLSVRLHECTIFDRITENLQSGYTVRKGEVSRQTSAQRFLDHLLRLWTYVSGGFYKKHRNSSVLSKCHSFLTCYNFNS